MVVIKVSTWSLLQAELDLRCHLLNSEEAELFMAHWGIPLRTCSQVHSLDSDWLLAQEWTYLWIYVPDCLKVVWVLY